MDYGLWAEWYDVVYATQRSGEVEFYVDLARASGGPVLEIGAGTGRIAIPTGRAGIDVVGVDLNEQMLARARQALARAQRMLSESGEPSGSIDLVHADMRDFDLGRTFPLVTIPARTLLLATTAEGQQRTLERAAAHLAPGGTLAFNVFVPEPGLLADDSEAPFEWGEAVHPETGRRCRLLALNRFDTLTQTNDGLQIVEELDESGSVVGRIELAVEIRYLYPSEVFEMVAECGLAVSDAYGDFDRSPFTEASAELIVVASHAA